LRLFLQKIKKSKANEVYKITENKFRNCVYSIGVHLFSLINTNRGCRGSSVRSQTGQTTDRKGSSLDTDTADPDWEVTQTQTQTQTDSD
jgi:hypothetical protein